jgi:hypothetical protein
LLFLGGVREEGKKKGKEKERGGGFISSKKLVRFFIFRNDISILF